MRDVDKRGVLLPLSWMRRVLQVVLLLVVSVVLWVGRW